MSVLLFELQCVNKSARVKGLGTKWVKQRSVLTESRTLHDITMGHVGSEWQRWKWSTAFQTLKIFGAIFFLLVYICVFNTGLWKHRCLKTHSSYTMLSTDDFSVTPRFFSVFLLFPFLIHWGQDKMAAIFQTTFSNGFSWLKMYEFRLKFRLSLFLCLIDNIPALVQIMAWRRQATSLYLNQWWIVYWRIYASLGLSEIRPGVVSWNCVLKSNID